MDPVSKPVYQLVTTDRLIHFSSTRDAVTRDARPSLEFYYSHGRRPVQQMGGPWTKYK